MMNKLSLGISVVAILLTGYLFFRMYPTHNDLVYVDVNKVIAEYKAMKDARAAYEIKAKELDTDLDSLFSAFERELKLYEQERTKMSKKEIELKEELLRNRQLQLSKIQDATDKKKKEEEKTLTQTVYNDINDYIEEYGKEHNYKIILGATGGGNILYAEKAIEITDKILEGLNKEYKK